MNNAGDRKDIRRAEKAAKVFDAQRLETIRSIMIGIPGRAWMHDLLVSCHVFQNPFTADTHMTAFACGEMNIGQRMLSDIMQSCPDQYILMMREANERHASRERTRSQDSDGGVERSDDPDFDNDGRWIGEGPDPRQPGTAN